MYFFFKHFLFSPLSFSRTVSFSSLFRVTVDDPDQRFQVIALLDSFGEKFSTYLWAPELEASKCWLRESQLNFEDGK